MERADQTAQAARATPESTVSVRPSFPYVDCVRGYAVLLVMICHVTYEYPELPYPLARLTRMGWHGVQLFFLASAFTLLVSWHHALGHHASGATRARIAPFFLRRFFRIAPAYYAAAGL